MTLTRSRLLVQSFTPMQLILFDIDGTLIRANGAGKVAMVRALEEVFGTSGPSEAYRMAGKTDPLIIRDLLTAAGIAPAEIEAGLQQVYDLMASHGLQSFVQQGIMACPGVTELLSALAGREDVLLGLLTGNISQTAPLKLAAAGINPGLFRVGAYGSDHADRNSLPPIAMSRAAELTGQSFSGNNTIIIGDTPADITCARVSGARSLAVASGGYSAATLAEYQPDHLLANLVDTETVLALLLPQ
jgi:phosphoglycolate phosphatase